MIKGKPYYYLRECQRVKGKPKIIWTMYLGSSETIRDRVLNPEPHEVEIFEFGASAAAFDIASTLDIVSIIDRHVRKRTNAGPSVGQYLLLADAATDTTLIFDKGNNSEDNMDAIDHGPYHFVGSLVPTHHQNLLAIPRKKMRRLENEQLPDVWSYRTVQEVFGIQRTVLCTFNQPLFDAQYETLVREIGKRKQKLTELQDRLNASARGKKPTMDGTEKIVKSILRGRHMKDLFTAQLEKRANGLPKLSFGFRQDAWKELQATLLGKTILFTDRDDWTDEQIVLGYRSQYHVEEAFRCMKNPHFLTFRPTFHWTDQKLRVHAFYCVLALMILSILRRKLGQKGVHLSIPAMMQKLADIREVAVVYQSPQKSSKTLVRRKLSKQDQEQRVMLKALHLLRYHQT